MENCQRIFDSYETILYDEIVTACHECYNASRPEEFDNVPGFCPRVFDGWSCWNKTEAGNVLYGACPNFISGFDPNRLSHKECLEDGTWYRHPLTNESWSNYTSCVDLEDWKLRQRVNQIFVVGYSVSLATLLLSILIFFYFRGLWCTRVTIHKNLFVSFIINNSLWLVMYQEIVDKADNLKANSVGCQILHVFLHYFMVCNYFWMFCEGLYLHTLLVIAFVAEDTVMRYLYLVGWFVPAIFILIYALVRAFVTGETENCWIGKSKVNWILSAPVCLSMLANLVFLVNIVRVLVTKLRANNAPPQTQGTRKAVRATFILIPLLGLHYIVIPFRPEQGTPGEEVYEYISAIVTSLQGFCVSLLFCFCNGEVISLFKKKWNQHRLMQNGCRNHGNAISMDSFHYHHGAVTQATEV